MQDRQQGVTPVFVTLVVEEQLGVAHDRGEHVVVVVRHTAGQAAEALHLLRLEQLLFHRRALFGGPLELRDVAAEHRHAEDVAFVRHGTQRHQRDAAAAVVGVLGRERPLGQRTLIERAPHRADLGRGEFIERLTQLGRPSPLATEALDECGIERREGEPLRIHLPHAVARAVDQRGEQRARFRVAPLRIDPRRDVAGGQQEEAAAGHLHPVRRRRAPELAPVLAPESREKVLRVTVAREFFVEARAFVGVHPQTQLIGAPPDRLRFRPAAQPFEAVIHVDVGGNRRVDEIHGIRIHLEQPGEFLPRLIEREEGRLTARGFVIVAVGDDPQHDRHQQRARGKTGGVVDAHRSHVTEGRGPVRMQVFEQHQNESVSDDRHGRNGAGTPAKEDHGICQRRQKEERHAAFNAGIRKKTVSAPADTAARRSAASVRMSARPGP